MKLASHFKLLEWDLSFGHIDDVNNKMRSFGIHGERCDDQGTRQERSPIPI